MEFFIKIGTVFMTVDAVLFFLYFLWNFAGWIYGKFHKEEDEFFNEDEEISGVHYDSIRSLTAYDVDSYVRKTLIPYKPDLIEGMSEKQKEGQILFLSSCLEYLVRNADKPEKDFATFKEILYAARASDFTDAVDLLMQEEKLEGISINNNYRAKYNKYKAVCSNEDKAKIIRVSRLLLDYITEKLDNSSDDWMLSHNMSRDIEEKVMDADIYREYWGQNATDICEDFMKEED